MFFLFNSQKAANLFLRQIPSIAENFQSSSPMHGELCDVILSRIKSNGTEIKPGQISQPQSGTSNVSEPMASMRVESKETQGIWQQFDQLNSMTYREKQDFLDGQDLSHLPQQQIPQQQIPQQQILQQQIPQQQISQQQIPQQIPQQRNRMSPYRGRGVIQTLGGRRPRGYPSFGKTETPPRDNGDTIRHPPAPYLRIKPVDEKMIAQEKDNHVKRLGNPKSLLYQYWSGKRNNKFKGISRKDFDGRLPSSEQNVQD